MPKCDDHAVRQISCRNCYTDEELSSEIETIQAVKVPQPRGQGEKSRPRRVDETKVRKKSWLDDFDV